MFLAGGEAPAAAPAVARARDLASTAHQRLATVRVGSIEPIARRGDARAWTALALVGDVCSSLLLRRRVPLERGTNLPPSLP
jgi:hypothetical protein